MLDFLLQLAFIWFDLKSGQRPKMNLGYESDDDDEMMTSKYGT